MGIQKCCRNYYLCGIAHKCLGNNSKAREFGQKGLECVDDGSYSLINENIMKI